MKPSVSPLGNHAFQLIWPDVILTVTFRRLIEQCQLQEPYVLQHYQGKPVGHRYFGYYDGHQYLSLRANEIIHETIPQAIEIEDSATIRPCAVNCFYNSMIVSNGQSYLIKSAT